MTLDTSIREDQTLAATHRAMWALGDYALMAEEVMAPLGPILVAATGIGPGVRVLDVAAGSGNISLPAAKTGATVVSTDLTPELLQRSAARATELGLTLDYQEANAQALPFGNDEFDTVISAIGVMFAPDHQCAADELVRVCRPGGTIGVISWTSEGFFGRMLATIRPYRPSLSAALPPRRCGDGRPTSAGCWAIESPASRWSADCSRSTGSTPPRPCTTTSRNITARRSKPTQTSVTTRCWQQSSTDSSSNSPRNT